MTLEIINTGAFPNDATGDPLQTAFQKCNANFATLNIPNLEIDSLLPTFNVPLGLVLDGVTDNTTIIQTALNSGVHVVTLPTGLIFMASGITIPAGVILKGMGCIPGRTGQTGPQGTVLLFGANVATCVTIGPSPTLQTAGMCDLVVTRNAMTATSGTIGILVQNATMVILRNVMCRTHGILYKYYSQSDGIHAEMQNCFGENPTTNFIELDGWPELYIFGGRYGAIPDVAGANAFIYLTATNSGAAGPNTLTCDSVHFNGNGSSGPAYFMQFDNVQSHQANQVEYKILGCHIESVTTGVIGTTSSAPYINRFYFSNNVINDGSADFFGSVNASTQLNTVHLVSNFFLGNLTLNSIALVNRLIIADCYFQANVSFTGISSVANNMKFVDNFVQGAMTLAGTWDDLTVRATTTGGLTNTVVAYAANSPIDIDCINGGNGNTRNYALPVLWGEGTESAAITIQANTARGTFGSPSTSEANDVALNVIAGCWNGAAYKPIAGIRYQVTGAPTSSSNPGQIIFSTTTPATTTTSDWVVLTNQGNLQPVSDNTVQLGASGNRWTITYTIGIVATNFTCGTSGCGFFGAIQEAQPTTAGPTSTFVANSGTAINSASTFDGYTLAQVVKGLRTLGLLA